MKHLRFSQQFLGVMLVGLLLVGCGTVSTSEPIVEPSAEPTAEPTVVPTVEQAIEPTLEPTAEPTESAPIGTTILLLGSDGNYIDMYPLASSPLTPYLQVPVGVECEVLSGPRTITGITLWEIDCSWNDECCTEGYGLWGWVDVTNLEVLD